MRITKHEHAALRIEKDDSTLIVDPGALTNPLENLNNLVGVIITHEHPDHWSAEHLDRLRTEFADVPIYGPAGVAAAAAKYDVITVSPGDTVEVGPFTASFFGGKHAVIHESVPMIDNVGVLIDDTFYYPGDSYALPDGAEVDVLAAPVGAPWLKIGDAIDFVLAVNPRRTFATHDMTLSSFGRGLGVERLTWATKQGSGEYVDLAPGQSIEL